MPLFDISEKRPSINIFKLGSAYYFKHFFDGPPLFRELEPYYENGRFRFKMATAGERNRVMKLLDMKGYDPTLIEDPATFTVGISRIFRIESKLLALRYQYQRMYQCCSHDLFFPLTLAVHISAQCSNNSSGSSAHVLCCFFGEGEREYPGGGDVFLFDHVCDLV